MDFDRYFMLNKCFYRLSIEFQSVSYRLQNYLHDTENSSPCFASCLLMLIRFQFDFTCERYHHHKFSCVVRLCAKSWILEELVFVIEVSQSLLNAASSLGIEALKTSDLYIVI